MMSRITEKFLGQDGKAMIVAMDHGILGAPKGFKNPRETLEKVLVGKPDGILVTPNFARTFQDQLNANPQLKLVIRLDIMATSTLAGVEGGEELQLAFSDVEEALEVGADAVITLFIYGRKDKSVLLENMKYLSQISKQTHKYNIPHVMEVPFWGKEIPQDENEQAVLLENACRVAFELGADIVKTPYLKNRKVFQEITGGLPIPVLILGGSKISEQEAFQLVESSLEDGARGVFFGRNIWQHGNPGLIIKAFNQLVHNGVTVEEALKILN
ncbi:MAG: hypothetical protein PVG90_13005 [Bacillota bacterium]|jgi:DhnA family fructose-bisphosphate aldolase class Ia